MAPNRQKTMKKKLVGKKNSMKQHAADNKAKDGIFGGSAKYGGH